MNERHFVPLQVQARLPNPVTLVSLCPSMDLVAIGLGGNNSIGVRVGNTNNDTNNTNISTTNIISNTNNTNIPLASSVVIYRSIGWQKLMTLQNADIEAMEQELEPVVLSSKKEQEDHQYEPSWKEETTTNNRIASIQWSPNGRQLVIGLSNGRVLLYNIETCSSWMEATNNTSNTSSTSMSNVNLESHSGSNIHHSMLLLPTRATHYHTHNNENDDINNNENDNNHNDTQHITDSHTNGPNIMTRSMTLARQKRMMRMTGKTPNAKSSQWSMAITSAATSTSAATATATKSSSSSATSAATTATTTTTTTHHIIIPIDIQWQRIRQPSSKTFQLQSIFLDKSQTFLPKCQYMDQLFQSNDTSSLSSLLPKACTPLTILAIRTTDGYIHYHAHGQYRLVSIPIPTPTAISTPTPISTHIASPTHMILDSNFQTSICCKQHVHLIQIPLLTMQRYNLQYISHFYIHMTNHIHTIVKGMKDVSNAWSSSVKPLDMKFDQLHALFVKYAVLSNDNTDDDNNNDGNNDGNNNDNTRGTTKSQKRIQDMSTIRMQLLHYILGGHSSRLENTCNALDQFFTHPLMNDQLLLRMFKTCETNVMAVEQRFRKEIMGPIRSLLFDVGELNGMVHAMNQTDGLVSFSSSLSLSSSLLSSSLMRMETCQRMVQVTKVLWTVAEQCLSQIVEVRTRLDCMMKWIRSTASLVKAKGTATDSVQRQNARKRLVSEQVLRKVADFLSTSLKTDGTLDASKEEHIQYGSTECILGILLTDYFHKKTVHVEKPTTRQKSIFCNSRGATDGDSSSDDFHTLIKSPSLKEVLKVTTDIYLELFEEPRAVLHRNINIRNVVIEECIGQDDIVSAIHTRFRSPNEVIDDDDVLACNTNWTIIANTCKSLSSNGCQQVQITAIPTGTFLRHESEEDSTDLLLYKSTLVSVPENCTVSSIQFYGDDGNSTLTSETSPSYKEGRQSLGIVLHRRDGFLSNTFDEELWLFQYDNLHYSSRFAASNEMDDFQVDKLCNYSGRLVPESTLDQDDEDESSIDYENEEERNSVIGCRWRKIRRNVSSEHGKYSQIVLSGSRGVGGVYSNGTNTIDLYDLEEDEEEDEEEEDDDDDDEEM